MTGYSRSPRLTKGAIVAFRPPLPIPSVIPFQYNPETLSRTVEARAAEGDGGTETFRLAGVPKEKIAVDAMFDAADDLERGDSVAETTGLSPRLAALETLLYPEYATTIANTVLMNLGTIEVLPAKSPFTIFIWGKNRILPVRLSNLSITEEAYDPALNPIRAKVGMELQVLTTQDLKATHPGYGMYLAHHVIKETMAAIGTAQSLGRVLGSDVRLL
ncbi:MAG: hypothetical protein NXH97_15535 [Rhodobacteraceae bacterium]|nr:hypothetical protein [Paracoccaceae bacterium]